MFGRRAYLPVLAALACSFGAGCSKGGDAPFKPTFALVAGAGGFDSGTIGARAHAGLLTCASVVGSGITEDVASAGDEDRELLKLATEAPDEVIAVGSEFEAPLRFIARNYESVHFALIDGSVDRPNVTSITFKDQDGAFLAGALAALVSKTRHVAVLGGADIPRLRAARAGFVAGIREIDPHVTIADANVGSFVDAAAGKAATAKLFAAGDDIVYVVAGRAGLGAIDAAKATRDRYLIAADSDFDAFAPGKVLTSVLRRYDNAANRVCQETIGQKPASQTEELGLAEDGVDLTKFAYSRDVIGAANIARIGRLRDAIVAGTIVPPTSLVDAEKFRGVTI